MRAAEEAYFSEDDNCYRNLWWACALVYCCTSQEVSDQQRSRQTVGILCIHNRRILPENLCELWIVHKFKIQYLSIFHTHIIILSYYQCCLLFFHRISYILNVNMKFWNCYTIIIYNISDFKGIIQHCTDLPTVAAELDLRGLGPLFCIDFR